MFAQIHNHSIYSLLDGAISIPDLVKTAKDMGMTAVGLTDHGSMAGAVDFYKECRKQEIKPIIGCEVYTAPHGTSRLDHTHHEGERDASHLILLAKSWEGYQNLCRIVSAGWTEGFYRKPRVDLEVLEKWHDGVICTSACLAGVIPQRIMQNDYEGALSAAKDYQRIFGDDFYIEVQDHGLPEDRQVNDSLIRIAHEIGAKIIATNDCHYLHKKDAEAHEVMLAVQSHKKMKDPDRMRFKTNEFYFKSEDEMRQLFPQEYLDNTVEIAEKCNVELEFGINHLPQFPVPEGFTDEKEYFEHICHKGLIERYGENHDSKYDERLNYEISVIEQMNFVGYFLIVQDFINWAKDHGILVGPGRGSAAGSIACYCMKITEIDPMKYNLLFERFLNPERVSMPDIDVDFPDSARYSVIDYVKEKYGKDHVTQIATFSGEHAKNSLKDTARVFDIPPAEAQKLSDLIPDRTSLEDALEQVPQLKQVISSSGQLRKVYSIAEGLQGKLRGASRHAGGVLIADRPVTDYAPLMLAKDQETGKKLVVVEYEKVPLEDMGLIKMDFLGLKTLSVIHNTLKSVEKNHGVKLDINHLDPTCYLDVYRMLAKDNTIGVFQFESEGMVSTLKDLFYDIGRIDNAKTDEEKRKLGGEFFERLVAAVSLYRPGPKDYIPEYAKGIKDPGTVHYDTPKLEPILKDTYGVIVYQEQVQQICRDLAGFSYGKADIIRRAMSKKKLDLLKSYKEAFIHGDGTVKGCVANGIPEKDAEAIWDKMEKFASYAFNKSHAAAYSFVSFQTAFLKKYYEPEYLAALLSSKMANREEMQNYLSACRTTLNIPLKTPDINRGGVDFTSDGKSIMFGLAGVNGIGTKAAKEIIEEREKNGEYQSLYDFCRRTKKVGQSGITSLIRAGAFDYTGYNRRELEIALPDISAAAKKDPYDNAPTLFDFLEEEVPSVGPMIQRRADYDPVTRLMNEKSAISQFVSGNPLDYYRKTAHDGELKDLGDVMKFFDKVSRRNPNVKVHTRTYAMVEAPDIRMTKKNTRMMTAVIEDGSVTVPAVAFDRTLNLFESNLHDGSVICADGTVSLRNGKPQFILDTAVGLVPDGSPESRRLSNMLKEHSKSNDKKGRNQNRWKNHER